MLSIFFWNSFGFHTFLLSLFLSLNCPFLSKVRLADLHLLFLIPLPGDPYFFKFYFLSNELSFLPVNIWAKLLKPGISEDNAILS
jgi:hypothetical protein